MDALRKLVRQAEHDSGHWPKPMSADRKRIKVLEREDCKLRQANQILCKTSLYFIMAEFDRRSQT